MRTLSIDIETFSSVDLQKSGVYPYTEAPDFDILLFAYAFNDEPVKVIDLCSGVGASAFPQSVMEALTDPDIIKTAFNANFERTCLSKYLDIHLPVEQWECTAVHSLMLGLPGSLDKVAQVLNLDQQKFAGKPLINFFSKPCKPTKANGNRIRNTPEDSPEKWREFMDYCKQDVEVERAVKKKISLYKISDFEKKLWHLDPKINDRGILTDPTMIRHALACDAYSSEKLIAAAKDLTGIDNPNSVAQLKNWIEEKTGTKLKSMDKAAVQELLQSDITNDVKKALKLRVQMAKTSVAKYEAMDRALCLDHKIRGLLQFYGANRTGRWAGRLVQVQNLPQNKIPDLNLARETLIAGDYELLGLLYGSIGGVLSQLIRTAFVASPGNRFIVADFSAIEARVIAWLAGEQWVLDVFKTHGKIYEATASRMFHVPIEKISKGNPEYDLRQRGKVAVLGLGYGMGVDRLISMAETSYGIVFEPDEAEDIVSSWRTANQQIVRFWKTVENAAKQAIENRSLVEIQHRIKFIYDKGILFIQLPSGRRLSYLKAKLEPDEKGRKRITYEGMNQTSRSWETAETYGGKLVENIVQATARDCLAEAMINLDTAGYDIVMHVHDEIVIDAPFNAGDVEEVNTIMGRPIGWAPGLPLTADAYETYYYRKD